MSIKTGPSAEAHAKAARTRLKRKQDKEESITNLDGGAIVYQDSPPGIGIVLQFKSRKCYYRSTEMAIDFWYRVYANDFGTRDDQGRLSEAKGTRVYPKVAWELPRAA